MLRSWGPPEGPSLGVNNTYLNTEMGMPVLETNTTTWVSLRMMTQPPRPAQPLTVTHTLSPCPHCSLLSLCSPATGCPACPGGPTPGEERSTHRELVVRPQHVLLLLAGRVPADVAHYEERGGQADGRARQDTPPKGRIKHLPADHQGQSQEQSVCPEDKR